MGIAIGIEQTGFGGEHGPATVDFDGAALEDHAGRKKRQLSKARNVLGNGIVQIEGRIFVAPGVVAPINDGALAFSVPLPNKKNWPVIPAPRFIGREMMEIN